MGWPQVPKNHGQLGIRAISRTAAAVSTSFQMATQSEALLGLAEALARSESDCPDLEEAWLAAMAEAAGRRYEHRLLATVAGQDLETREKLLEGVRGILDDFEPS